MKEDIGNWILQNLFPESFYDGSYFPESLTVFRRPLPWPLLDGLIHDAQLPAPFSRKQLYSVVMKSCAMVDLNRSAWWFQVNVHDNCALVLERAEDYNYPLDPLVDPIVNLYGALETNPAVEGGASYAGLLGKGRDWLMLLERENDFVVYVAGPSIMCQQIMRALTS